MEAPVDRELLAKAQSIFRDQQFRIHARTDRMFAALMVLQWLGGIIAALILSPLTWKGAHSEIHPHVYAAVLLGGVFALLPIYQAWFFPGRRLTRYVIAVSQMLFSSLFIHLSGGRIETHFHVFGSLAFLAFYRDWTVLVPATVVVALDHFVRGMFWPESVFGIADASQWRWVEHAAWVVFEDIFLVIACRQGVKDLWNQAFRRAELERRNTEYQERTIQLEEAYRSKNAIVETALDAVVSMSADGKIIGWNSQAERTFGWTAAEAIGRDLADTIIPADLRKQHRQAMKRFQETGIRRFNGRVEIAAIHRDGHLFPIEVAISPIYAGQTVSFCAFVRDITERTQAASALCKAKEAAETASQAKSLFLAQMSHEIRTPLNGILGFADVLRRMGPEATEEERKDYLETINRSGRHLLGVINDVLDLSKIESGQMEVDPVRCAPHGIIADAVSILRVRAQEKGIDLRCRWLSRVPESIVTDPSRFRQLLMNLIGNAIKFTDEGSVEVLARLESRGNNRFLAVDVNDTGIGIAPEHLESIFEPFVQADGSITRRFGGTGLGLTISRQIAERLGGSLEVTSEVGQGSRFIAKINAGSLEGVRLLDAPVDDVVPHQRPDARSVHLAGASILLVEDGATNRKLIDLVLRRAGARVAMAENGQIGINMARAGQFDLILMDMQMPVLDGYQAAAELRRDGLTIPIVALTANAMKGDAERCLAAGCSGFLSKPIDSERLLEGVASALQNARPSALQPSADDDPIVKGAAHRDQSGPTLPPVTSSLPVDDPDFVEIIREFVERLKERLKEMRQSAADADFATLASMAHWLKGSGGSAGFQALTLWGGELEHYAQAQDAVGVVATINEIDALTQRIQLPDVPLCPSGAVESEAALRG